MAPLKEMPQEEIWQKWTYPPPNREKKRAKLRNLMNLAINTRG